MLKSRERERERERCERNKDQRCERQRYFSSYFQSHCLWVSAVTSIPRWGRVFGSHSLTAGRSVVFLSSTVSSPASPPPLCLRYVPPIFPQGARGPPATPLLIKLPKSRITAHLHSFIPLFSCFGTNLHTLLSPSLPSRSSKQLFTTISYLPPSISSIFSIPVNPPQTHLLQIPCCPSWKSL